MTDPQPTGIAEAAIPPFTKEQHRAAIDAHKANVTANPWKRFAYDNLTTSACIKYWIEQVGDAELYEERYRELDAERGAHHD